VFSEVPMACNLDGEALLWAAGRLADRKERTKLLIVICDGLPDATMSVRGELERHLYVTAKRIETCEGDGLHLAALGIGEERVRRYYKNSEVLSSVGDLPTAVLGIVERAMSGGFD
jgi:cobalamin biosynthesis protein CobT